jgi:ComF family protein
VCILKALLFFFLYAMLYLQDLSSLFFPEYCAACATPLVKGEEAICFHCQVRLPKTSMFGEYDNQVERLFWGRADVRAAAAFLKMPKQGMVHQLIHLLKYHDHKQVGVRLGKLLGNELKQCRRMGDFDVILPVPLHPKKLFARGYNQCDCIAEGIEFITEREIIRDNLIRIQYTDSQTRKSRFARWKNVETIFHVNRPDTLEGKKVLLVDDVITTGSTIEACANVLTSIPGLRLDVASLAMPV